MSVQNLKTRFFHESKRGLRVVVAKEHGLGPEYLSRRHVRPCQIGLRPGEIDTHCLMRASYLHERRNTVPTPQVENSDAWRDTGQDVAEKWEAWLRFSRLLKCRILVRHSVVTGGHDPSPLIHPIAVTPRRPSAYVPAPLNESKGLSLLIRRRSERLHLSPRRGSCPTQNDNSREFVALELSADG